MTTRSAASAEPPHSRGERRQADGLPDLAAPVVECSNGGRGALLLGSDIEGGNATMTYARARTLASWFASMSRGSERRPIRGSMAAGRRCPAVRAPSHRRDGDGPRQVPTAGRAVGRHEDRTICSGSHASWRVRSQQRSSAATTAGSTMSTPRPAKARSRKPKCHKGARGETRTHTLRRADGFKLNTVGSD